MAGTKPAKPGLARAVEGGAEIEIELYEMGVEAFGRFTREVPAPLAIGSLETREGEWVKGFVCEGHALSEAQEITRFGGWRAYLNSVGSGGHSS
ncbi:MAG: hypothetical protein HC904_06040 [Blastochloris sp.]|nr:hypothetical protein [Blastochloris sp.]